MVSRMYVFMMSMAVIFAVKDNWIAFSIFVALAFFTEDKTSRMKNEIYADTKRIVSQYFDRYFGRKEDK